jgi:hypothetical protein
MFFFFPFGGMEAPFARDGSSGRTTLPLLPAPRSAFESDNDAHRGFDVIDLSIGLLHRSIAALTSSLTALGNSANALFAQVASALALDRVTSDAAAFINAAFGGFGAPLAGQPSFGFPWAPFAQNLPSFSPQSFMAPWAIDPWTAFAESFEFWTKMWMPMAPQSNPQSRSADSSPFTTKGPTPGAFSWAFSL